MSDLETLRRAVDERRPAGALDAIAHAEAVAADLTALGERLVGWYVERARHAGHSWAEIGEHAGISRQAAQQRFTPRATTLTVADLLGAGTLDRYTARARQALARAQDHARRWCEPAIGPEHLALGILDDAASLAVRAVAHAGTSPSRLRRDLERRRPAGDEAPGPGPLPVGADGRRCLTQALREALRLGHNYIGTEHLLLGCAAVVDLGLEPAGLRTAVTTLLDEFLRSRE